ncbi:MAG: hypothetical protein O2887_19040 [Bacteroidetes bacterium]|nr:hypothetical protein [Bacteroidota bacterium]
MEYLQIGFNGFLLSMLLLSLLWLLSIYLKNASIIDPFWGTGFIILIGYYLFETENFTPLTILKFITGT